ncbi:hypothetical protein AV656_10895 [Bhargavaea cecembensis]|uniref:Uncharacterized protein n=1 Tax=Bhargavaea cecembensis TaxID=394098 RepID=A0A165GNI8_9BACL|nr:hypothetical protein [Bhargavaea cecembensis]KZE37084.1 hypothetical protein AV656_10895 [Bhargavaea cecembensis]
MRNLSTAEKILFGIALVILVASIFNRDLFRFMFLAFAIAFVYRVIRPKEGEKRGWNLLIVALLLMGFLLANPW